MPISFPLEATVSVTARANIRQGSPSVQAPILRRVDVKTDLAVHGWCGGDKVAGNEHWWKLDNDAYIWSGVCSEPVIGQNPTKAGVDVTTPIKTAAVAPQVSATTGPIPAETPPARFAAYGFEPAFAVKLGQLLDSMTAAGHDFRIGQGVRPPQTQALYYCEWRQRTPEMIDAAADQLERNGAPWLSVLLRSLRDVKRSPDWQTSQLPGSGWHQWGEAADCYCYRNGVLVGQGNDPVYKFYADKAREIGLTPGFYFSHQDSGHVQLRPQAGASDVYSWAYIDATMKSRFGAKPELSYDTVAAAAASQRAVKRPVANRGVLPDDFLAELVQWGRNASADIFEGPDQPGDVYSAVQSTLGPYPNLGNRRAVMLEILRVLAGFESSWRWNAGADTTNPESNRPETMEAGAWQVSANSMDQAPALRALVVQRLGSGDPLEFQRGMKQDHSLAMEYIARLLRVTIRANGPVLRHEIDDWLSRDAVAEFEQMLA